MRKKILIVDDEPSIIVPLQFLMETGGFTTLQHSSAMREQVREDHTDLPEGGIIIRARKIWPH